MGRRTFVKISGRCQETRTHKGGKFYLKCKLSKANARKIKSAQEILNES